MQKIFRVVCATLLESEDNVSQIRWSTRTVRAYEPASYTANETATVMGVAQGEFLNGICIVSITEVFNGAGTDAIVIIGDGDDANGLLEAGQCDETTVGIYRGGGAYYVTRPKLYTVDDTVDIGFTANTSGSRTTGILDFMIEVGKVHPW